MKVRSFSELEQTIFDEFINVCVEYKNNPTDSTLQNIYDGIDILYVVHKNKDILNQLGLTAEFKFDGDDNDETN